MADLAQPALSSTPSALARGKRYVVAAGSAGAGIAVRARDIPMSYGVTVPAGYYAVVDGDRAEEVWVTSGTAFLFPSVESMTPGGNPLAVQLAGGTLPAPTVALVEAEFFLASIAVEVETVQKAGTVPIPIGTLVRYALSLVANAAAGTAPVTYVAVKGHDSGRYYAVCFQGNSGGAVTGDFRAAGNGGVNEALDLVVANAGAGAVTMEGCWAAFAGE